MNTNPHLHAFESQLHDVQSAQLNILGSSIDTLMASDYGASLQLHENSAEHFRQRVPLVHHDTLRPWLERINSTRSTALYTERTLAFFQTSGSTAIPKLIPVTGSLVRQKMAAFSVFWAQVYRDYPDLIDGAVVTNFTDIGDRAMHPSGIEICSETSFWTRRRQSVSSSQRQPLPASLRKIGDRQVRLYAIARLLLQAPLHGIMCLNPSTLLQLCRLIQADAESLIVGLRQGSWGTPGTRQHPVCELQQHHAPLLQYLQQDMAAAGRLEAAIQATGSEPLRLALLWPMLQLIICWQSKLVQPYLSLLAGHIADLPMRDFISQSSECCMAIPDTDGISGGTLAYTAHFFEFIEEHRVDEEQPDTLFAWQLTKGRRYELVVTTGGGLYRYRTGDCVCVIGFRQSVPIIEFLYRLGKTSSITGEKLTEWQLLQAAQQASAESCFHPAEFLCYPCTGYLPHYACLVSHSSVSESTPVEETAATQAGLSAWVCALDKALQQINSEYREKRESGRLGNMAIHCVEPLAIRNARLRNKPDLVSDEQVKSEVLSSALDLHIGIGAAEKIAIP